MHWFVTEDLMFPSLPIIIHGLCLPPVNKDNVGDVLFTVLILLIFRVICIIPEHILDMALIPGLPNRNILSLSSVIWGCERPPTIHIYLVISPVMTHRYTFCC